MRRPLRAHDVGQKTSSTQKRDERQRKGARTPSCRCEAIAGRARFGSRINDISRGSGTCVSARIRFGSANVTRGISGTHDSRVTLGTRVALGTRIAFGTRVTLGTRVSLTIRAVAEVRDLAGDHLRHLIRGQGATVDVQVINAALERGVPPVHTERENAVGGCEDVREATSAVNRLTADIDRDLASSNRERNVRPVTRGNRRARVAIVKTRRAGPQQRIAISEAHLRNQAHPIGFVGLSE